MSPLSRGPVFLGVEGLELSSADRERLVHPLVGGVILFARNFESPPQLKALTGEIGSLRSPRPLIAVDHEGGRVQRFREGFSAIAPMRTLGELWDRDVAGAAREAVAHRSHDRRRAQDAWRRLQLHAGARRRLRRERGDRQSCVSSQSECDRASRVGALRRPARRRHGRRRQAFSGAWPRRRGLAHGVAGRRSPARGHRRRRPRPVRRADRARPRGHHAGACRLSCHRHGSRRLFAGNGCRRSCADGSASTASSFPTISAWRVRKVSAISSPGRRRRSTAGCDMVLACNDFAAADMLLETWRPVPGRDLARRAARMELRSPSRRGSVVGSSRCTLPYIDRV